MADTRDFGRNYMHHQPPPENEVRHGLIRKAAHDFALLVSQETETSREQSLALTKIEEAMFWANAAIARNR